MVMVMVIKISQEEGARTLVRVTVVETTAAVAWSKRVLHREISIKFASHLYFG